VQLYCSSSVCTASTDVTLSDYKTEKHIFEYHDNSTVTVSSITDCATQLQLVAHMYIKQ